MSNPFAGKGPGRVAHERQSDLDNFLGRLTRLGVAQAERDDVAEHWDDFDEDWTPAARDALVRASDRELRAQARASAEEYAHDTTEVDDFFDIGWSVKDLVEWVDEVPAQSAARARLVLDAEGTDDPRKTLVTALAPLA